MLVASDHLTNKDYPAANMVKGDLFVRSSMRGYTAQSQNFYSFLDDLWRFSVRFQCVIFGATVFLGDSDG